MSNNLGEQIGQSPLLNGPVVKLHCWAWALESSVVRKVGWEYPSESSIKKIATILLDNTKILIVDNYLKIQHHLWQSIYVLFIYGTSYTADVVEAAEN